MAMAKTPGEHEPIKPISKEVREARKAFRQVEAKAAMSEHQTAEKAFAENRERLKAERLTREASAAIPAAAPKPKKKIK
jgi:hypothetical protein